ncbi:GIY-YIG nuclease family protein [Reyranella sp.]|uniref:GIY-YIG nuclease family protein n=1 Tax=Reyranella sp. TaxID=1929291 RepID=UPI003D0DC94C
MTIPFEPTRSYVYRATRYEILPKIAELAREFGEQPFLLRELSRRVLSETYSQEQLDTEIKKEQSDEVERMSRIFGFYIPFLAKNLNIFERCGGGIFKNLSRADEAGEIEEAEAEADAEVEEGRDDAPAFIYAYSFPSIERHDVAFPIKIGLTRSDDADARVRQQCRQTCCFEYPKVLQTWRVLRVSAVEHAIHFTLSARGRKRDAPGTEWFDTTVAEIDSIVRFVQGDNGGM